MRNAIVILVMLLITTTSYNQTTRRSASSSQKTDQRSTSTRTSTSNAPTRTRSSVNTTNSNTNNRSSTTSRSSNSSTRRSATTQQSSRSNNSSSQPHRRSTNVNSTAHRRTATRSAHTSYPSSRSYRGHHETTYVYRTPPRSKSYRSVHYAYRAPRHVEIIWTRDMHRNYITMYPEVRRYNYEIGYRIRSISAYNADLYYGEVMNVYGKITEVYYSRETDEYFLYMGPYYPYQDFTIVVPGYIARRYSRRPVYYFDNQYINVTGLITSFEGKPEIVIKRNFQLGTY